MWNRPPMTFATVESCYDVNLTRFFAKCALNFVFPSSGLSVCFICTMEQSINSTLHVINPDSFCSPQWNLNLLLYRNSSWTFNVLNNLLTSLCYVSVATIIVGNCPTQEVEALTKWCYVRSPKKVLYAMKSGWQRLNFVAVFMHFLNLITALHRLSFIFFIAFISGVFILNVMNCRPMRIEHQSFVQFS